MLSPVELNQGFNGRRVGTWARGERHVCIVKNGHVGMVNGISSIIGARGHENGQVLTIHPGFPANLFRQPLSIEVHAITVTVLHLRAMCTATAVCGIRFSARKRAVLY